jgi:hypothetical protein
MPRFRAQNPPATYASYMPNGHPATVGHHAVQYHQHYSGAYSAAPPPRGYSIPPHNMVDNISCIHDEISINLSPCTRFITNNSWPITLTLTKASHIQLLHPSIWDTISQFTLMLILKLKLFKTQTAIAMVNGKNRP